MISKVYFSSNTPSFYYLCVLRSRRCSPGLININWGKQAKLLDENRAVVAAWSQICLMRLTQSIGDGIAGGSLARAHVRPGVSLSSWCQGWVSSTDTWKGGTTQFKWKEYIKSAWLIFHPSPSRCSFNPARSKGQPFLERAPLRLSPQWCLSLWTSETLLLSPLLTFIVWDAGMPLCFSIWDLYWRPFVPEAMC